MDKKKKNFPRLNIVGHKRHGKDTLAELLGEKFGLKFKSSSQACADIFIYDVLKEKYGYQTPEECFEDRMNHRQEWYEMICDYNKDDRARLAKEILKTTDCYVGMRDRDEITECLNQELFDIVIWVDASERLPLEGNESFNIDKSCADIVIENNGTYEEFVDKVNRLGKVLTGQVLDNNCKEEIDFLDYFSRYAVIDKEYDFHVDSFFGRVDIDGWPKTKNDYSDDMDPVDLENLEIIELDSDKMVIICGGDYQEPLKLTIKVDENGVYVDEYEVCNKWVTGFNGYELSKLINNPCY